MENNGMFAQANSYIPREKKHFDKVALIDADKMKHLVAYDVACDLKNNMIRSPDRLSMFIDERLAAIFTSFSAKGYIFCFSGKSSSTFRSHVAYEKEYKGTRKEDPNFYEGKIEDMAHVVKVVMEQHPSLIYNDLEADDILSFLQCPETFIYSNDKDLKQIPGMHYDFKSGDLIEVTEEQAMKNLCYQLIIGDSTDCILGLKGYGPKKAEAIIQSTPVKQLISKILYEYQLNYGLTLGTDAFVETWNLVKLRPARGAHFLQKYESAKNLLDIILLNTK
jgi:5'-3' exonuclease